jgi:hypothetical protein
MKSEQQQRSQTPKKGAHPGAPEPRPQVSPVRQAATPAREPDPRERAENEGMTAPHPESGEAAPQVEGEGRYTATHHYREGLERSLPKGDAERLAEEAARALDGPEGKELRRAEQDAKHGHASPAPAHKKAH